MRLKIQQEITADSDIQVFSPDLNDNLSSSKISFSVLASGSSGNCVFVSSGSTNILFDAGLSGKEIEKRMAVIGKNTADISAIVISHEHNDHIKGAGVLSRRYNIPVYGTPKTIEHSQSCVKKLYETKFFNSGTPFFIDEVRINPFSISHDAADPCGFTIKSSGSKLGIATDLGISTHLVKARLQNCTGIILEANHDPELLASGPYPWPLKQRVKSRSGHLSNQEARDLLGEILNKNLKNIVLGHLSMENNCPHLALETVSQAIKEFRSEIVNAAQDKPTSLFSI